MAIELILSIAEDYAKTVCETIKPFVAKSEVVGSIRRRHPIVHDIDVIAIPSAVGFTDDEAWNKIPHALNQKLNAAILKRGKELITVLVPNNSETLLEGTTPFLNYKHNIQVDIYRARTETWGVLELIRTGSKEHNVKLCAHAMINHMKLSAAKGVIKEDKVIASATEQDIFAILGLAYVRPEDRETQDDE